MGLEIMKIIEFYETAKSTALNLNMCMKLIDTRTDILKILTSARIFEKLKEK